MSDTLGIILIISGVLAVFGLFLYAVWKHNKNNESEGGIVPDLSQDEEDFIADYYDEMRYKRKQIS